MNKIGLILLAGAALAQAPPNETPAPVSPYRNVGNMSRLMIDIIYPTSDAIFYVDRDEPKTEVQWNTLASQALMLAESGNLLMMPGRARDGALWMKQSRALIEAGAMAAKAADAKDAAGLMTAGHLIDLSCDRCHRRYMKLP